MAKQPSFQFYPGDWLKDPALRRCSPAARGAFMDLLCYAFECEPRGYLITNGTPWTEKICAKVASVRVVFVRELVTQGVLRRDEETGAFYNKRMVEDERLRRLRADSGSLGGQQTAKQKSSKRAANRVANGVAKPGSSSSSSSSSSASANTPPTPLGGKSSARGKSKPKADHATWQAVCELLTPESDLRCAEFQTAWGDWVQHRKEKKAPLTPQSVKTQIKQLDGMGVKRAVAMIRHTLFKGWQGLRESDETTPANKGDWYDELAKGAK